MKVLVEKNKRTSLGKKGVSIHPVLFKGFMIIETIIAVSIIVFALIGPLSAAKSSLTVASDARDYVESVYLADELVEYMRMKRDIIFLLGIPGYSV